MVLRRVAVVGAPVAVSILKKKSWRWLLQKYMQRISLFCSEYPDLCCRDGCLSEGVGSLWGELSSGLQLKRVEFCKLAFKTELGFLSEPTFKAGVIFPGDLLVH